MSDDDVVSGRERRKIDKSRFEIIKRKHGFNCNIMQESFSTTMKKNSVFLVPCKELSSAVEMKNKKEILLFLTLNFALRFLCNDRHSVHV
jgi:hypothetical protein